METINYSKQIQININRVYEAVQKAALKSARKLSTITLVAVSKTQPIDKIEAAIDNGLTVFGENYPEEAEAKIVQIKNKFTNIQWHMIGHLQSRKADIVCRYFSLFHSLDSVQLAEKLNRRLLASGNTLQVLLEINISGEKTKSGWCVDDPCKWEKLIPDFEKILNIKQIVVKGLMAMPPLGKGKEESRPYFIKIKKMQEFLNKRFPKSSWEELSLGTSYDYEVAIEEGATLIRVGEAIFGKRSEG
jgi:pyridoxal phosphate enzyme (YggS family)